MFGTWRAHFTLFSVMKLLVNTFTITTVQEYTKKHVRVFCKLWGFSLTKHLHVSASFYLTTPYTLYRLYLWRIKIWNHAHCEGTLLMHFGPVEEQEYVW